jgi:capsular exopolysaccharide synthesis family protein
MAPFPQMSDHPPPPPQRAELPPLFAAMALCRSYRWLITGWVVICMALATVVLFSIKPLYKAHAELVLDSRLETSVSDQSSPGSLTVTDPVPIIRSQVQLLQSPSLVGDVVNILHLNASPEFDPRRGIKAWLEETVVQWATWVMPSAEAWLRWLVHADTDPEREKTAIVENYLRRLSVVNDGRSFTASVSFWASDPYLAVKIANAHAQRYIDTGRSMNQEEDEREVLLLGKQLERLRDDLVSKERALRDFKTRSGLVPAQGASITARQAAEMAEQLSRARADLALREAKIAEARSAIRARPDVQSDVLGSLLIQRLREQESDASKQLAALRSRYEPGSPVLQQAQARLADVQQKIAQETARINASMDTDVGTMKQRVALLTSELGRLTSILIDQEKAEGVLAGMERDISAIQTVYRDLLSRQQQIQARLGVDRSSTRLASPALVPKRPSYPNIPMFLFLSFALAAGSGVGMAFLAKVRRGSIGSIQDLDALGSTVRLQPIPLVSRRERHGRSLPDYMLETPMGEFADAIRSLRGDIMYFTQSDRSRVLAITSALPGEGKTTIALTIARSLASLGLRVLLIDCDLRRSQAARMLGGASNAKGGTIAALQSWVPLEEISVKDPRSSVELLIVEQRVGAPQDLLGSARLKQLLDSARIRYDFIILDTPPEGAVSDVHLIAPYVDAMILLVRWKLTPMTAVTGAITAFEKRGIELGGIVLNAVDMAEFARASGQYGTYRPARAYHLNSQIRG